MACASFGHTWPYLAMWLSYKALAEATTNFTC
jgi:hypothetical protein